MALQEQLDWLSNTSTTVITTVSTRIDTFYLLVTTSEPAAVAFLAGILVLYFTVAITVLVDQARDAYKRMPK